MNTKFKVWLADWWLIIFAKGLLWGIMLYLIFSKYFGFA